MCLIFLLPALPEMWSETNCFGYRQAQLMPRAGGSCANCTPRQPLIWGADYLGRRPVKRGMRWARGEVKWLAQAHWESQEPDPGPVLFSMLCFLIPRCCCLQVSSLSLSQYPGHAFAWAVLLTVCLCRGIVELSPEFEWGFIWFLQKGTHAPSRMDLMWKS